LKIAFWALVTIDLLGIGLLFLLGLAAAGSTRSNPLQVALYLLVLPCLALTGAVVLFLRAGSPLGRTVALLLAASPLLLLAGGRAIAEVMMRSTTNEAGEMTFYRSGPMRELAEAIARNDAATVQALVPKVNVNDAGLMGVTPLLLATRQLRETPRQHEILRMLLRAKADPNKGAQYELPFEIVIQESGAAGLEPVKMMLDAGANPNAKTSFGDPIWWAAIGKSSNLETLSLLLDRGADINAMGKDESTVLIDAANVRNWPAVLLLLQRGADWRKGKSVNGMPFKYLVEGESGSQSSDSAYQAVRRVLQQAP
jgi:uncharacterized protein